MSDADGYFRPCMSFLPKPRIVLLLLGAISTCSIHPDRKWERDLPLILVIPVGILGDSGGTSDVYGMVDWMIKRVDDAAGLLGC